MKINELIIFAEGFGSRLSEETNVIQNRRSRNRWNASIWHIMKYYSQFGVNGVLLSHLDTE